MAQPDSLNSFKTVQSNSSGYRQYTMLAKIIKSLKIVARQHSQLFQNPQNLSSINDS